MPRSGATTLKHELSGCFELVIASDAGGKKSKIVNNKEVNESHVLEHRNQHFINIDVRSHQGIDKAQELGFPLFQFMSHQF